jgi:hypothetical protein
MSAFYTCLDILKQNSTVLDMDRDLCTPLPSERNILKCFSGYKIQSNKKW